MITPDPVPHSVPESAPSPERMAEVRSYVRRMTLFRAESNLADEQFVTPFWNVASVPVQFPRIGADGTTIVRCPENVGLEFLTHPVYFCDPELVGLIPTDGESPDRYAVRIAHILRVLGVAGEPGSKWPGVYHVNDVERITLTTAEREAHRNAQPSPLDSIYYSAESLRVPYAQVLTNVWNELETWDPEGNAALAEARAEQIRTFEKIEAEEERTNAVAARFRAFEQQSGLAWGEYYATDWAYPLFPEVSPRRGDTVDVLVQAPAHVNLSFLGHPAYWLAPEITAWVPTDGDHRRYCLRMQFTLGALGLLHPDGSFVDLLEALGDQASDTHRRNHLRGRETPLDAVYVTWDQASATQRQVLDNVWAALEICDPEGNADLQEERQAQLDSWAHEDFLNARAAAEQAVIDAGQAKIDKAARRAQLREDVALVREYFREVGDNMAARAEAREEARERKEQRLARQIYIDRNRRR